MEYTQIRTPPRWLIEETKCKFFHFVHQNNVSSSTLCYCHTYVCRDQAEAGIDVFAGVIEDLYQRTDSEAKGYVNWKMFTQLLQSAEMSPFLQEKDTKEIQDLFKSSVPGGKASFNQFRSLAKELILRVYRAKDPSDVSNTPLPLLLDQIKYNSPPLSLVERPNECTIWREKNS